MLSRLLVFVLGMALATGAACLTAPAAGRPPTHIAPGVVVYGVAVGGFSSEPARAVVRAALARPVVLAADGTERRVVPEALGVEGAVDDAVAAALTAPVGREIRPSVAFDGAAVTRYVRRLDARLRRPPQDARLLGTTGVRPRFAPAVAGRSIDRARLAAAIRASLETGDRDVIEVPFRRVSATKDVRTFGPVVVIARFGNRLFLYDGRKPVASFPVATGQSRYPTPIGTFRIVDMQRNPWWYPPPTSEWARGLKPVPPGPGNPLGTRWMGLDAYGVGIHGTPDAASLGYSASHGCIRMAIPSAEWLFEHVDVGTPVVIAPA